MFLQFSSQIPTNGVPLYCDNLPSFVMSVGLVQKRPTFAIFAASLVSIIIDLLILVFSSFYIFSVPHMILGHEC